MADAPRRSRQPGDSGESADLAGGATPADLIDLCVVGGGIAGTVAALRAQELGLDLHLLEAHSLLHTLDPPEAGHDIETIRVADTPGCDSPWIHDACAAAATRSGVEGWIEQLRERGIPYSVGARVFGVDRDVDGHYCIRLSDAASGREQRLRSRAVLLATGPATAAGDPVAASTAAVPVDAPSALQRPALVVGARAEAIEALIAISDAKVQAKDPHPVYWTIGVAQQRSEDGLESGLGDRLLEAWMRNRNLRFLAPIQSLRERTAVDGGQWVGVEVDRYEAPLEREEPEVFEFARAGVFRFDAEAESVGSAIESGADAPARSGWSLLSELSVRVERRDAGTLLVLDPNGRLSLPGLYVAGDVRGQEMLICPAFEADPAAGGDYERVGRTPSVEVAAAEAVLAVEAIAQSGAAQRAPAVSAPPPPSATDSASWQLVGLDADGSRAGVYRIEGEVVEIGRRGRDVAEPGDIHMADHHASIVKEAGELFVADSGRGSGVWLRIASSAGVPLEDEDQVWLGAQILVATREGGTWLLVHYGSDGQPRETYAVGPQGLVVGRGADHELDPEDPLLSRRHAKFCVEGDRLEVYDNRARNGTFIKVKGAHVLQEGSEFRVATRGYRLERITDS